MMPLKIIFFGLTGIGSQMLTYLVELGFQVERVFTRKEKYDHPYFTVPFIEDVANNYGIGHSYDLATCAGLDYDAVICSTYHRIIPTEIISAAKAGAFNFHPSMLPAYQGASPTKQCLLNGESNTGMTVHKLSNELDKGEIIAQRSLKIEEYFDDGLLRLHLGGLQYFLLTDLIGHLEGENVCQDTNPALRSSYYPPFEPMETTCTPEMSIGKLSREIRASSPFPGLTLITDSGPYKIRRQLVFQKGSYPFSIETSAQIITVTGRDGILKIVGEKLSL